MNGRAFVVVLLLLTLLFASNGTAVAQTAASAPPAASVNGKYSGLLTVVTVPGDRNTYGDFDDYGLWGPGVWGGAMQPRGYWVYVYPSWYVWQNAGAPVVAPPPPPSAPSSSSRSHGEASSERVQLLAEADRERRTERVRFSPRERAQIDDEKRKREEARKKAEDEAKKRKEALAACLAQPVTKMTVSNTNPFQVYVGQYEDLLTAAQQQCGPPQKWVECMGMNARLWPDDTAQADHDSLVARANKVGVGVDLAMGIKTTRSYCLTMGRANCAWKIRDVIKSLRRDLNQAPAVFEAEAKRNERNAQQARDQECRKRFFSP